MKKNTPNRDIARLFKTARKVFELLKSQKVQEIQLERPIKCLKADTDGWRVTLGNCIGTQLTLQIWLDFQTNHGERKFWFGFRSRNKQEMDDLVTSVENKHDVEREITLNDVLKKNQFRLKEPLPQKQSLVPIFENYWQQFFYFGMFDLSLEPKKQTVNEEFCNRAANFFKYGAKTIALHKQTDDGIRAIRWTTPEVEPTKIKIHIKNTDGLQSLQKMSPEDFQQKNLNQSRKGLAAQKIALKAEKKRLKKCGRLDLANRVKDVSETPSKGYDILSFEKNGRERYIEVKAARVTTDYTTFYLTENERKKSQTLINYFFYLVFNARTESPSLKCFKSDQLNPKLLQPEIYSVTMSLC